MKGFTRVVLAAAMLSAPAACVDLNGASDNSTLMLGAAFQTMPAGFSANSNSFDPRGDAGEAFMPRDFAGGASFHGGGHGGGPGTKQGGGHGMHGHGFGDAGIRGLLMGGGLGPDFIGLVGFGRGRGRGPFGAYALLTRPHGLAALALHVEDNDCAANVLSRSGFNILTQHDLSR